MTMTAVSFTVNGRAQTVLVSGAQTLQSVLHEQLRLHGVRAGCKLGSCGSCSVLLDKELVCSCLVPAMRVAGRAVVTIEGLAPDGAPSPVQQAFVDLQATQCGFCSPGMILAATSLLSRCDDPSRADVLEAISGNVCRCTGYEPVVAAILEAARRARAARE